jgi:aminopeptidase N
LQPTAEAKAAAWWQAFEDPEVPNSTLESLVAGFAHPRQGDLLAPYRRRYFEQAADVWALRSSELAQVVVIGLFPRWTSTISAETVSDADAFLARDDIPAALRRLVSEGRADVVRALRARAADRAAGAAES